MFKELLAIGVLSEPFSEPPPEVLQELRMSVEVIAPAISFGHPASPNYSSPLSVYYLPLQGQKFWIWDHEGFLCSTASVDTLVTLLAAEARPKPDPSRPYLTNGARELLFPGSAKQREENLHQMQDNARALAQRMRERGGSDPKAMKTGDQVLRTLGLDGES